MPEDRLKERTSTEMQYWKITNRPPCPTNALTSSGVSPSIPLMNRISTVAGGGGGGLTTGGSRGGSRGGSFVFIRRVPVLTLASGPQPSKPDVQPRFKLSQNLEACRLMTWMNGHAGGSHPPIPTLTPTSGARSQPSTQTPLNCRETANPRGSMLMNDPGGTRVSRVGLDVPSEPCAHRPTALQPRMPLITRIYSMGRRDACATLQPRSTTSGPAVYSALCNLTSALSAPKASLANPPWTG